MLRLMSLTTTATEEYSIGASARSRRGRPRRAGSPIERTVDSRTASTCYDGGEQEAPEDAGEHEAAEEHAEVNRRRVRDACRHGRAPHAKPQRHVRRIAEGNDRPRCEVVPCPRHRRIAWQAT